MDFSQSLIENSVLPLVAKPNRYVGNYDGACPQRLAKAGLTAVVAHPDVFERGFEDLDTRSAYAALNSVDGVGADLAFLPWRDLEAELAAKRLPLWGLESRRPIGEFDLILLTPATPLQFIQVVRLLRLGGLACPAAERDASSPIVAAIGPPMGNPAPLADFLDVALIGEPWALLPQVARTLLAAGRDRRSRLDALARLPGTLLMAGTAGSPPAGAAKGGRRLHPVLLGDPGLPVESPLAAAVEVATEGLRMVIRRGGGALRHDGGCRAIAPAWNIPVEPAVENITSALKRTGFDRVDLTGDAPALHPGLLEIAERVVRRFPGIKVGIDDYGVTEPRPALAREVVRGRRVSFNWSPLAGSERLRRSLNTECDEDRFLESTGVAYRAGCHLARYRFGIGWPGETDEDLSAISELVRRARALPGGQSARLTVMLDPFVPRPHSPLQWEPMAAAGELTARIERLRRGLEHGPVQVRSRPVEEALIDGLLSRGGREMGRFLALAERHGAATPLPTRPWESAPWLLALDEAGLRLDAAASALDPAGALPWDGIEAGWPVVLRGEERARFHSAERTPPASLERGFGNVAELVSGEASGATETAAVTPVETGYGRRGRRKVAGAAPVRQASRYRLAFAKDESLRFTAHLDVGRAFERALARVAYNVGSPKLRAGRLSFGPPLPLGMTSDEEYLDIQFSEDLPEGALASLADCTPGGLRVLDIRPVRASVESLSQSIDRARYRVTYPPGAMERLGLAGDAALAARLEAAADRIRSAAEIPVIRDPEDPASRVDVRPGVIEARAVAAPDGRPALELKLALGGAGSVRPEGLMPFALGDESFDARLLRIHRMSLRISGAGREFSPMEVVELDFPWWRETLKRRAGAGRP